TQASNPSPVRAPPSEAPTDQPRSWKFAAQRSNFDGQAPLHVAPRRLQNARQPSLNFPSSPPILPGGGSPPTPATTFLRCNDTTPLDLRPHYPRDLRADRLHLARSIGTRSAVLGSRRIGRAGRLSRRLRRRLAVAPDHVSFRDRRPSRAQRAGTLEHSHAHPREAADDHGRVSRRHLLRTRRTGPGARGRKTVRPALRPRCTLSEERHRV